MVEVGKLELSTEEQFYFIFDKMIFAYNDEDNWYFVRVNSLQYLSITMCLLAIYIFGYFYPLCAHNQK